eukprot:gb/GECG01013419.1/.p1 GENE.gb/GECG01013419.1/~~gb/GECG01013419.1/.p1  ORF type:complete len:382 (+),score=52.83 gb/GECG01013419.1/:1-1146(+)
MSATAEGEGQSSLEVHVWHEGYLHTVSMEPELVECLRRHHQDDTDCRPLLEEWEEQMTIFLWQLYSVTHVPVEYMRLVGMAQETVLCGEAEAAYLKELYRTVPAKHCHSFLLTLPDGGNEEFQASRRRHFASIVFEKFLHHPEIVALDSRRSFFGIIDDTRPLLSTSVKKDVDDELVRGLVVDAKEGDNSGSDTDFVRKCQQAADTIVEECSKIRFGSTPVVQPVYKVEMDNAGRKSPYLLCGACASTCLSPSLHASPMLVHEDNSFLNFGFVCQVSQLAQQHGDKGIMDLFGERSGEFVIEMVCYPSKTHSDATCGTCIHQHVSCGAGRGKAGTMVKIPRSAALFEFLVPAGDRVEAAEFTQFSSHDAIHQRYAQKDSIC